jgi:hypothetical protein
MSNKKKPEDTARVGRWAGACFAVLGLVCESQRSNLTAFFCVFN